MVEVFSYTRSTLYKRYAAVGRLAVIDARILEDESGRKHIIGHIDSHFYKNGSDLSCLGQLEATYAWQDKGSMD